MRFSREGPLQDYWSRPGASGADGVPFPGGGDARHDPGYGGDDERHDPVTGLPHPRCFLDRLERLLERPDGSARSVAMLVLEVADFHDLKARLGDAWADELLRTIAERLHGAVPEPGLMTRLSSGAFAIVLHDIGPEVMPETLATHLLQRASEPCPSPNRRLRWSLIGALSLSDSSESAVALLERAMRALARAKLQAAPQAGQA
ncbi:MAG TPA: GGDEF domain-containing protein [Geminicoccaceae bacterium]|nr:GGDEF domain-containing protein [Geminicoccaceae bacterium]